MRFLGGLLLCALVGCGGAGFERGATELAAGEAGDTGTGGSESAGRGGSSPRGGSGGTDTEAGGEAGAQASSGRGGAGGDHVGVVGTAGAAGAAGAAGGQAGAGAGPIGGAGVGTAGRAGTGGELFTGGAGSAGGMPSSGGAPGGVGGRGGTAGAAAVAGAGGSAPFCTQYRRLCFGSDCEDLDPPRAACWTDTECPHDDTCRMRKAACSGWVDVLVPNGWVAVVRGQSTSAPDCAGEPDPMQTCRMVTANGADKVMTLAMGDWKVYFAPSGTAVPVPMSCPRYTSEGIQWSCAVPSDEFASCRVEPTSYPEAYPEP